MVGDVIELPHLLDYDPLDDNPTLFPTALKRFYQVTDANFGSEGFAIDWYPHLWRIKCEKLVDSQEFADILRDPVDKDNYLGDWDKNKTYPAGYTMTFGDKNYLSLQEVPAGTKPMQLIQILIGYLIQEELLKMSWVVTMKTLESMMLT